MLRPQMLCDARRKFGRHLWVDRPDWDATDIAEDVQSLKQYRGKVILLDFWYRGCSSCIRTMPEIKRLAKHFEDEPVVVLGVNVDKRAEDAIDVIQKMQLAHPTIRGEATGAAEPSLRLSNSCHH